MKEFREWLDVSKIGFLGPILSITLFFMYYSQAIVDDKKMDQPVKAQVQIVAYPGYKKNIIYKVLNENLDCFKSSYQRNLIPCNLIDTMYSRGTTEV